MGWGFYMIHGCLQVFASELSVEARATALSLHSFFFFMGQTVGPIAYGVGIQNVGKVPTLLTSAVVMIALGMACARLLRQTRPGRLMPAHKQRAHKPRLAGGCHSMTVLERIAASGQPSRPPIGDMARLAGMK
jgi:hypothetical protein